MNRRVRITYEHDPYKGKIGRIVEVIPATSLSIYVVTFKGSDERRAYQRNEILVMKKYTELNINERINYKGNNESINMTFLFDQEHAMMSFGLKFNLSISKHLYDGYLKIKRISLTKVMID